MEEDLQFLKMEDDLKYFLKIEDNLNIFRKWETTLIFWKWKSTLKCFDMENDLEIVWKRKTT